VSIVRAFVTEFFGLTRPAGRGTRKPGKQDSGTPFNSPVSGGHQVRRNGTDKGIDGIHRPYIDLERVIAEPLGVDYYERYIETLFRKFCFSCACWRLRHLAQDPETVAGTHILRKSALADTAITIVGAFMANNARYSQVPAGIQVDAPVA